MTDPDAPHRARLPDVSLARLAGVAAEEGGGVALGAGAAPGAVPLRERRRGTALVLLGTTLETRDVEYLRQLAAAVPVLREWDGRVLAILSGAQLPGADAVIAELHLPYPVLVDPEGRVSAAAGVAPPAVVVCDQWGEVREAVAITDARPWLAPAELEQWMRFLSIQCAG